MCKLVEHPKEIISFSTDLKKFLKNCSESISDPKTRSVADKALNTLTSACGSVTDFKLKTSNDVNELLKELSEFNDKFTLCDKNDLYLVTSISANLCNKQNFDESLWLETYQNYLPNVFSNEEKKVINEKCLIF